MDKAVQAIAQTREDAFGTGLPTRRQRAAWITQGAPFRADGGQLHYHPPRHSGTSPRVSVIAWNAVRDQLGMGVRDQWNAHASGTPSHHSETLSC